MRQQLARAPVEDDAVAADHVELIDLAASVALGDRLGILLEPTTPLSADPFSLRRGRPPVDLVLGELGIELPDHHAVILRRPLDGHVAVGHVLADGNRVAVKRVAEAPAARRRACEPVSRFARDVREDGAEEGLLVVARQPDTVRDRWQAALDTPGDRASAVAHVRHDGRLGLAEDRALLDAAAAPEPARPAGIGPDLVSRRQHRTKTLLRLERLDGQADAEDRRGRIRSVLAVAAAPAPAPPVLPPDA